MNSGGDAAEQIVRLSLEGFEVAARLTGSAAKNIALLLASVLKQEQKTKGKARLTNMIKSGKELKVFAIPQRDVKKFTEQAKRYGVLYCVLRDKNTKDENAPVDIIARAEDASKINRIVKRFNIATVDTASIKTEIEQVKDNATKKEPQKEEKKEDSGEYVYEDEYEEEEEGKKDAPAPKKAAAAPAEAAPAKKEDDDSEYEYVEEEYEEESEK